MKKFFRTYLFSLLNALASVGIIGVGLWLNIWLLDQYALQNATASDAEVVSRVEILKRNMFDLGAPPIWFLISVALVLFGAVENFFNRYCYGELAEKEGELRTEKQEHGETKRTYHATLISALKNRLASEVAGFDETCRVTIYRRQDDAAQALKRIMRYSAQRKWEQAGRVKIPIDEGVVGAAWNNQGWEEFSHESDPNSQEFQDAMAQRLGEHSCRVPEGELSMPTKHYYARAVDDHQDGHRVAIVVFESCEANKLKKGKIDEMMTNEQLEVSRLIMHLGALDGEFNPDTGSERDG